MELRSDQSKFGDRAFHLIDRAFSFPWIDASEAYELPGVFLYDIGYLVVGQRRQACRGFGIPRKQHCNNIELFVQARYFVYFAHRDFASEEYFCRLLEWLHRSVEEARGRQMNVHVDGFWHLTHFVSSITDRSKPSLTQKGNR